jgi:hypothetical protein
MRLFAHDEVQAFVQRVHPGLRKTQFVNLCWVIFGLLRCGRPSLSPIARCIRGPRRLIHRIKRMSRFIDNPRLPQRQLAAQLTWFNWAMGARQPKPRVLMDYTDLGNGQVSLWAALAYRGRSVPLLCQVMPTQCEEGSRNRCEHEMILELKALLGRGWVLIADRGFARASLFEMLNEHHIDFVIRIDDNSMIYTSEGQALAGQLELGRKRRLHFGSVTYHSRRRVPLHLVICRRRGGRWNLASSLDDERQIQQLYASRMQIEEMFRDLKQHLGIERMRCTTTARHQTWLLLCAIAYSHLYWLGVLAQRAGLSAQYHYWKTESAFWLGLQLVLCADRRLTKLNRRLLGRLLNRSG